MGEWERVTGSQLTREPLLELAGELSVNSPGRALIRGNGAVIVEPSLGAIVSVARWAVRGGLLSKPRSGVIYGNRIRGYTISGDVVVVRYAEATGDQHEAEMQLAFRGRGADRLAQACATLRADWEQTVADVERDEAEWEAERISHARPLDEHEMTLAVARWGEITRWDDDDDESAGSQCGFYMARSMENDECVDGARFYFMAGLNERRIAEGGDPDDDDELIVCARCIRLIVFGPSLAP